MRRSKFVLAALLLLAACDDQVQVEKAANSFHTNVRGVATQARGEGDFLLVVVGADSVGSPDTP